MNADKKKQVETQKIQSNELVKDERHAQWLKKKSFKQSSKKNIIR